MRAALMVALAFAVSGCGLIQRTTVSTPPARCADMVPGSWSEGVEAAPVPQNAPGLTEWLGKPFTASVAAAIIAPWASGYVAMGGQLAKANGRTVDTVEIVRKCESLVNAARADRQ